jgi:Heterokaryon incompatibility protein (HET)
MQFIKTTKDNIEEHEHGIDWNSLSKTFQHAIWFTYQLDVRYLWIDSLCIIQDDEADWRREAGKMCSIFEGSFITLAASAAAHGLSGLLFEECQPLHVDTLDLISITPPKVDPQAKSDSPEYLSWWTEKYKHCGFRSTDWMCDTVYMRRAHEHWRFLWWPYSTFGSLGESMSTQLELITRSWTYREKILGTRSDLFPLFQRGWAYQERLLSPRVLHFGQRELLWECSQMSDCQCGGLKSIYSDRSKLDTPPKVKHYREMNPSRAEIAQGNAISRWRKVVGEYSALNLTFPSDKLPAIAGIARQLHTSIRCTYQSV